MSKLNGHANGHDDDGKVTSLDEARRRAAQKAKATKVGVLRHAAGRPVKDYIFGGLMIALAIAGLASFFIDFTGGATVPVPAGGGAP